MISGGGQLRRNARSGTLDWGTGGFELRGERARTAARSDTSATISWKVRS